MTLFLWVFGLIGIVAGVVSGRGDVFFAGAALVVGSALLYRDSVVSSGCFNC